MLGMPRLRAGFSVEDRVVAPQGPIAWSDVVQSMLAWRTAVDRMERRYALSERCHVHIYGVLNNQYEAHMSMIVEGSQADSGCFSSSQWPYDLTPQELNRLAEIRSMVDMWECGDSKTLHSSSFTLAEQSPRE